MMGKVYRIRSILLQCFLVIVSIILLLSIIPVLLVTVILPIVVIRLLALQTAKLNPHLGKPLSITSCHTAIDNIYGNPRATIVAVFYVKEKLDVDGLLQRIAGLLDSGQFPELKQCLSRWVCNYFWRECPHFSICNHVIFDPTTDPGDFRQKLEFLVTKPFPKGHPLWEITVFTNYRNGTTCSSSAIAIRIHHCLADGFALLSLIKSIADPDVDTEPSKQATLLLPSFSNWDKVRFILKSVLVTPVKTVYKVLQSLDYNQWSTLSQKQTGTLIQYEVCNDIDQQLLKNAAKFQDKSISSVIFAGFTAAIRNTMIVRHGVETLPESVTVLYPWPRLGHPATLTNHLTCVTIKAPVSVKDVSVRLNLISKEFVSLQSSALPCGFLAVNLVVGLISGFVKRGVLVRNFGTAILSNFLYRSEPLKFFGSVATHFNVLSGLQTQNVALMCNAVSYNGRLVVGLKADSALLPNRESAELFVKYMIEEFKALGSGETVV